MGGSVFSSGFFVVVVGAFVVGLGVVVGLVVGFGVVGLQKKKEKKNCLIILMSFEHN